MVRALTEEVSYNTNHMKPIQTGIAVALALAVIIFFFVFGGASMFASSVPSNGTTIETTTQNTSNTMPTVQELQITDEIIGTGAVAATGDRVTVNYVGALTNGTIFDTSAVHPETVNGFTFSLGAGDVIQGWDEGIVGMKVGGKRRLVIPASLAYGNQAIGNVIPANSTLVFEVELLKVEK